MSLQLDQVARLPDAAVLPHAQGQQQALAILLLALAAVVLLYHATFWSMLELWSRSQTFAHGFLIVPISCWLAWRQRARLAALAPQPSRQGLLLLGALGLAWLLADAANVPVVEQYAATAMLPACVLAILGWPAVRLLAFPLAYLFLAVPFGEVFLDPLIDFTAAFTVTALQWTGIPVFRDGNNFSLPTGNWSVVEACSGLRYLIAALALGALFAHVNFRSTRRRLAVMAAALIVPILANGVRAYLIVMLGHLSNMRLAVGVDHLIYGWLFFGLVVLLLFWLSARWRELPLARTTAWLACCWRRYGRRWPWPASARMAQRRPLPPLCWPCPIRPPGSACTMRHQPGRRRMRARPRGLPPRMHARPAAARRWDCSCTGMRARHAMPNC